MSYGAYGHLITAVRIGTNGAGDVLPAQLLAAYSLTRCSEADRVRGSWVTLGYGYGRRVPREEKLPYADLRTRSGTAAAFAFAYDGCAWLALNRATIARGRKLKPVRCPVLAAICAWDDANQAAWARQRDFSLTVDETAALADALGHLGNLFATSPWAENLLDFTGVVGAAAAVGGYLHFG